MKFPDNFVWGAATASYQIEGAAYEDGKGPSVWDMMCRLPGRVYEGHTGEVACDHYHRYQEDVGLMRDIGLHAYRLSISWPRVLPQGVGAANGKGLDFYDRLIDALLGAGIQPWVTLFHWDFPWELYCRGGWLNPDSPKWFGDYTKLIVNRLSDRVTHWVTHNEPQCFIGLGMLDGMQAPGDKLGLHEVLRAAHHTLLAHGLAVQTIRAGAKKPAQIGWAPVGVCAIPATDAPEDIAAARAAMFSVKPGSVWNNAWWADPPILGRYPEEGLLAYGDAVPKWTEADMRTIRQPLDFYGANVYSSPVFRAGENGEPVEVKPLRGAPHTANNWHLTPRNLRFGTRWLAERYKLPLVITENGMSGIDWVSLDGKCHDPQRVDLLSRYLIELHSAIVEGVDIRGYFQWSIMDNFEWQEGYKERFGLIHVDYNTQRRTLKDSAHWYREVIRTNGSSIPSS